MLVIQAHELPFKTLVSEKPGLNTLLEYAH